MTDPRAVTSGPAGAAPFAIALLPILLGVGASALIGPFADHRATVVALLVLAGAGWLAAVRLARSGRGDLRVVIGGAIALRCLALAGDLRLSDDVYRYLWEGRVVLDGASPYAFAPDDPELADLRRRHPELHARVAHRGVPAAYPPFAQLAGAAGAQLADAAGAQIAGVAGARLASEPGSGEAERGARGMRCLFAALDLLALWPLAMLLDAAGLPRALGVAWGWCPLVVLEFAGAGHHDSFGIGLLLGALALPGPASALVVLSAAALVKWLPLMAFPWIVRGRGIRGAASGALVVAGVCALAFVPFLLLRGAERGLSSGLVEYATRWESGSLVYRWIEAPLAALLPRDETWTDPRRLGRALAAIAWLACAIVAWRRTSDRVRGTAAFLGAFLVLSPTLHPWYLTWIVPFLAVRPSAAWSWLVLVAPLLYWPLAGWQHDGVWIEPAWLWPLVALPFLVLLGHETLRPRARVAP